MTEKYRQTPKGRIAPNGYRLCDPLPEGQILIDNEKKHWVIGKTIGVGGFGEIYLTYEKESPSNEYVMKLDNMNGPLFVEVNFVLRACQKTTINAFMEKRKLSFLGIPRFIASGTHQSPNGGYRFLIMERLGEELQNVLETRRLRIPVTCRIACKIIDALEYIHDQGYIHADIKAQNILRSINSKNNDNNNRRKKRFAEDNDIDEDDNYYLIDYGLVEKYTLQGVHKPYEFDKRKANNGTCEFRSRDAHLGIISRRSDIESLGFNLILWFYGRHPWANVLKDAEKVLEKKNWAMKNINEFLREAFNDKPIEDEDLLESKASKTSKSKAKTVPKKNIPFNVIPPKGLSNYFEEINLLSHDARPNYTKYKKILEDIAKFNPEIELINGNAKKSRYSNSNYWEEASEPKSKLNRTVKNKKINDNNLNGELTESDDTEIEDYVDSNISSRTKTTRSNKKCIENNKNKKEINEQSDRRLRNRIKTEYNIDNDSTSEFINKNKSSKSTNDTIRTTPRSSRYSTPLMAMTPPDGGDSPLFGPFEPEDSMRILTSNNSNNRNKKCSSYNFRDIDGNAVDELNNENSIDRRLKSCRIYINNKRCRPRQSYDEDDFNGIDHYHTSSKLPSTNTLTENGNHLIINGKSIKSITSSIKQNGSNKKLTNNQQQKTNGLISSSINSSGSRSSRRKQKKSNDHYPLTSTPVAVKSTVVNNVPETAAMQRIRMMIQNKKKK